jgi:hypothetical protein
MSASALAALLVFGVFAVGFSAILGHLVCTARSFALLRDRHPAEWEELGRPRLAPVGGPPGRTFEQQRVNSDAYLWLLTSSRVNELDPALRRYVRVGQTLRYVGIAAGACWIGLFVWACIL